MAGRHGRCRRGELLRAGGPHRHWKTTTFVVGLGHTGMITPRALGRLINLDAFHAYAERALVPELNLGEVVVMADLSNLEAAAMGKMIEEANAGLL